MKKFMVGNAHPTSDWPTTYQEAVALQEKWRGRVRIEPLPRAPRLVGGADAICDRGEQRIFGVVVVYRYPDLEWVEEAAVVGECPFPYRTGLLSFREVPILVAAFQKLRQPPEVLLVDGQGIAHPRGLGLATHLGLVLDTPTIGVAKSRLVGEGQVGLILRTQKGIKPLYLSPGHRITLPECLEIVLNCVTKYRIPLPLRQADLLTRRLKAVAEDPGATQVGRSG
jgi:deoxyribonuclease V